MKRKNKIRKIRVRRRTFIRRRRAEDSHGKSCQFTSVDAYFGRTDSALDPISESKLYEQFDKISKDRTTIFISHRLGSTWLADEIIVMNQGNIVQQGPHMQLMKECELYKTMYEEQRSWYNEM